MSEWMTQIMPIVLCPFQQLPHLRTQRRQQVAVALFPAEHGRYIQTAILRSQLVAYNQIALLTPPVWEAP